MAVFYQTKDGHLVFQLNAQERWKLERRQPVIVAELDVPVGTENVEFYVQIKIVKPLFKYNKKKKNHLPRNIEFDYQWPMDDHD